MPLGKLNPKTVTVDRSKTEHKDGELSSFQFGCNKDFRNNGLNRQKYDQYMVCGSPTFKGKEHLD